MILSRKFFIGTLAAVLFFLCSMPSLVSGDELNAEELVKKIDDLLRGESSYMEMKMTVSNPDWARPRSFEMYAYESKVGEKAFIRITAPPRDRGCGFLKIGYNLWMFIPRTERVMKIPPSMMHQSWMGSDFTNDDLVRESSIVNDYKHRIIESADHPEGGKVYNLELLPKPDAPVVWGKILLWVWDKGFIPTREQFFDEEGRMINEMIFSEIKQMGGRRIPTLWEMRSMTKPGHKTILELTEAKFDMEIDPGIFTEKRLKKKN